MSYHYSSYQKRAATSGGYSTTTTRTSVSDTVSTLVVRELTETEVSNLPLSNSPSHYEITDEDRLTPFDFYSLMESEDESFSESSSESDVEHHWFPSLLKKSVIEFLDDNEQEKYMDEDYSENVIIIENDDSSEEEDSTVKHGNKRLYGRHSKKYSKRPRKSDLVPVEVVHIIL